jgi:hypothetical protein
MSMHGLGGKFTVSRDRINPLVQRAVQLRYNPLLPFLPHESQQNLAFVDGVLDIYS